MTPEQEATLRTAWERTWRHFASAEGLRRKADALRTIRDQHAHEDRVDGRYTVRHWRLTRQMHRSEYLALAQDALRIDAWLAEVMHVLGNVPIRCAGDPWDGDVLVDGVLFSTRSWRSESTSDDDPA